MKGQLSGLARTVPACCRADRCYRDGCEVRLDGAPRARVVIDMDCKEHRIQNERRCDYLFFGERNKTTWVAPIELKRGKAGDVDAAKEQLEGGATAADGWLRKGIPFQFVPVLAHGRGISKRDRNKLLSKTIKLRGKKKKIILLKCGDPLTKALP